MTDRCPYCHGTGRLTEQSPHVYDRREITGPCDCIPRDPPCPTISSDDLLYGPILARGIER